MLGEVFRSLENRQKTVRKRDESEPKHGADEKVEKILILKFS
jgi:hypothetical protein